MRKGKQNTKIAYKKKTTGKVTQVKSILMENELLNDPIFFYKS